MNSSSGTTGTLPASPPIHPAWGRRIAAGLAGTTVTAGVIGGFVAWRISNTPGGSEEWLGVVVSDMRTRYPSLVEPIADLEQAQQRWSYEVAVWWHGGSDAAVVMHDLPASEVATLPGIDTGDTDDAEEGAPVAPAVDPAVRVAAKRPSPTSAAPAKGPKVPGLGPADVPAVPFDPAILSVPLDWAPLPDAPSWAQVAWPVLNPTFPDDHALVLKFDMTQAGIRWQPGATDPWPTGNNKTKLPDAVPPPDRSGRAPKSILGSTWIAFGGGWESVSAPIYGAMWDGRAILPLHKGVQTAVIYADGHTAIGPWGSVPTEGALEARQNLAPLVFDGKLPSNITSLNRGSLGAHHTRDDAGHTVYADVHTWRSALGRLANGDLVYVFADRATPLQMAATLIRAGAIDGMELDINAAYHCAPTLFHDVGGHAVATALFPGVKNSGTRFVTGSPKDFFYLTDRAISGLPRL